MSTLFIDFETEDLYVKKRGLGGGWVYKLNYPEESDFRIVGCAYKFEGDKEISFTDDVFEEVPRLIEKATRVVAHNAAYDLGCILYILKIAEREDLWNNIVVYDTFIAAKINDTSLNSYSLDNLSKKYLNKTKKQNILAEAVWNNGMYIWNQERKVKSRPKDSVLINWAYENLDTIYYFNPSIVSEYAKTDIELLEGLYNYFIKEASEDIVLNYSKLVKVVTEKRKYGVRVDLDRARKIHKEMVSFIQEKLDECYNIAGKQFNINSTQQIAEIMDCLGIKYPSTEKGNPSITSSWLKSVDHPLCKVITDIRKAVKFDRDFIKKFIDIQEYTCPKAYKKGDQYGRLFPEFVVLGAVTGRFRCSGPNVQQIPKRDKVYGPLARSIFVPEPFQKWYSLDYSAQEIRLQVHYACKLKIKGAEEMAEEFREDPEFDAHQRIADLSGLDRSKAKAINFGLCYGMGSNKLAKSLSVSKQQALDFIGRYNEAAPYIDGLVKECTNTLKIRGSIRTIGGRYLKADRFTNDDGDDIDLYYKATNKLIQGSGADQIMEAMLLAYDRGVPFLFSVHDEICMSGTMKQAKQLKQCMLDAIPLEVPSVAEISGGNNWAETSFEELISEEIE